MQMQSALAAMAEAVPFPGAAAVPRAGNNDGQIQGAVFPTDARAVIHCPAPSVMSSGRRHVTEWVLEFEPRAPLFIDPMMGWTGSTDTLSQVRLRFPTRQAAVDYAERQGLRFEIREPTHIRRGDPVRQGQQVTAPEHHLPLEIAWAWEAPHLALDKLEPVTAGAGPATCSRDRVLSRSM